MDILRLAIFVLFVCKEVTSCYTAIALRPPLAPTSAQVTCTTINGTGLNRTINIQDGESNPCTQYLSSDGEMSYCSSNKLFNLDLCDCWRGATVDTSTCRTRPTYDVKTEMKNLLDYYGTKFTQVSCPPLPLQGFTRTVFYSNIGPESCNHRHFILLEKNNMRVKLRDWRLCEGNDLFNLDLCDCWSGEMTNDTTCRTSAEYDVSTLQRMLMDKYNNTGIIDIMKDRG